MEIIAYYLPQYYPFKENNEWWGEGFTEWTNVGKAKRYYKHHDQPKVPKDLGYYDLRLREVQKKQIELAREAGVSAFCYWHYWFGEGRRLLDMPLNNMLEDPEMDFPFCLGWANETWKAKVWNTNDSSVGKTLIEQKYLGQEDDFEHFKYASRFFRDKRYLRIDGCPVFVVYKPLLHPEMSKFINYWNSLVRDEGIAEKIFFIGHTINYQEKDSILSLGFDAVNIVRTGEHRFNMNVTRKIPLSLFKFKILGRPLKLNYSFISQYFVGAEESQSNVFPTIIPNWDHTPRSGKKGVIFHGSDPKKFGRHVAKVLSLLLRKDSNRRVAFLKSWNEWGEGNYMEPDLKYGKAYIQTLRQCIESHI